MNKIMSMFVTLWIIVVLSGCSPNIYQQPASSSRVAVSSELSGEFIADVNKSF